MFLVGPWKQTKNMFKEKRIVATSIYLVMLVITLVVAFKLQNGALVLICVFIQFLAMLWYSISYIPFARDVVRPLTHQTILTVACLIPYPEAL